MREDETATGGKRSGHNQSSPEPNDSSDEGERKMIMAMCKVHAEAKTAGMNLRLRTVIYSRMEMGPTLDNATSLTTSMTQEYGNMEKWDEEGGSDMERPR